MNIEKIIALSKQLDSLGFKNMGYSLLKKICFKPDSFYIAHKIEKGKDQVSFELFFEKDLKENAYVLRYYEAALHKETILIDVNINGINTVDLERSMKEVVWEDAFDCSLSKQIVLDDKINWEKEQKIEVIVDSLFELERSEDGRMVATEFKLKYWAGLRFHNVYDNIVPLKNKSEVSQRFYFFDGQIGISVDEAYRFLQNRWLEKDMQAKRKINKGEMVENKDFSLASSENGIPRKRKVNKSKISKPKVHP